MSNAEQAWKEEYGTGPLPGLVEDVDPYRESEIREIKHQAFLAGYTRGRADAMDLPEVRADELVGGEFYQAQWKSDGDEWTVVEAVAWSCGIMLHAIGHHREFYMRDFRSFRGPLPLGGGE